MSNLYLPTDNRSPIQNAYNFLFTMLNNHYKNIQYEMQKSNDWILTPKINNTINIEHKVTGEKHNPSFLFLGYYNLETEDFLWKSESDSQIFKQHIEDNYKISEYLENGSCIINEFFAKTVHIRKEHRNVIPTFIRMLLPQYRLVCLYSDEESNKIYYGLIDFEFEHRIDIDKFWICLSLYKDAIEAYSNK